MNIPEATMLDAIVSFTVPLITFAAGIGIQAWRTSKRTGQTMLDVLRGKTIDGGGGPGEER